MFTLKLRDIYILGAMLQFVMFYFTSHTTPDTSRYFHMATCIRNGFPPILLFSAILAYSPFPFIMTGIVVQFIALQAVLRLVYELSKSKGAVVLTLLALVYQSTFIMTETLFAMFILLFILAIKKGWLLFAALIALLCLSLKGLTLLCGDFVKASLLSHSNYWPHLLYTVSHWKVILLLVFSIGACVVSWEGSVALLIAISFLAIPVPPDSFVRYMVPFLPLCMLAYCKIWE